MPVVHGLYRYPVKSMRGEALEEAVVGPAGLLGDRAYAVIDRADGKIASAKNPRKWAGLLGFAARFVDEPTEGEPAPPVAITCPDDVELRSDDPDVDARLSKAVGREVRLAVATPDATGLEFEEVWPDIDGLAPQEFVDQTAVGREEGGDVVSALPAALFAPPGSFFDLSVVHVLTTATLARLAELEPEGTFDVRRYRPNVLLDVDGEGFVENDWVGQRVALGDDGPTLDVRLPTMRCVMTTLAQEELPRDRSTLQAIAAHNRVEIAGLGTWACAGAYCDVHAGGRVRIGDEVRLGS